MTSASPPSSLTSRAAASRPARPRASSASLQPCFANPRAVARPIPADAPVITATSATSRSRIADPPDRIADIVGDDQRARAVDRNANGTSVRLPFSIQEAGHEIERPAGGLASGEANEDHPVAVEL